MHTLRHRSLLALLVGAAALAGSPVRADLEHGSAAGGQPFVTGGVGQSEQVQLQTERDRYSLWILTAARGTGDYLADVRVDIQAANGTQVFGRQLTGPWLLVNLRPGAYDIQAATHGQVQKRRATVPARGHRELVFYFEVPDGNAHRPAAAKH